MAVFNYCPIMVTWWGKPWAYAWNGSRRVKVIVIAQYARRTADGRYDAGRGKKIGVITAHRKGMNKCPARLSE
ncbi:hypothetical protein [Streptomyces boluensis]|uniref:Uncharacterized protein n=1 Tax=Streptomyces boluensis TaxID=1775135 RepID=A0A964UR67_9ACTN|nr:hypothetical protein [Streptomyces boluensis]NBE52966.1 hypothetical protein [Streptomyces boluensis]